jgi:hypothetical protein
VRFWRGGSIVSCAATLVIDKARHSTTKVQRNTSWLLQRIETFPRERETVIEFHPFNPSGPHDACIARAVS